MGIFDTVDWNATLKHYEERVKVHEQLLQLHKDRSLMKFFELALGISDPNGNHSASEHNLGPKIQGMNREAEKQVHMLSSRFMDLNRAHVVPNIIRDAGLRYLQIGIGSEMSCMINPYVCWVANTRTIWTHLVVKHGDNVAKADEELRLYRESDVTSEMNYQNWSAIHRELDTVLTRIAEMGSIAATAKGVLPGGITYLWADAIANDLYGFHHGERS